MAALVARNRPVAKPARVVDEGPPCARPPRHRTASVVENLEVHEEQTDDRLTRDARRLRANFARASGGNGKRSARKVGSRAVPVCA